jgi:hypothetical protein
MNNHDNLEPKESDYPMEIWMEIHRTKQRPLILGIPDNNIAKSIKEIIFTERVNLAMDNIKQACDAETLVYLLGKAKQDNKNSSLNRMLMFLYQKFNRKYNLLYPEIVCREPLILGDMEMDELLQLREWLYAESIKRFEEGITHPNLEDV